MSDPIQPNVMGESNQIYRQGKLLVFPKNTTLPDRCIKSFEPTTSRLKRSLSWHHPAWYLLILVNLLVFVIVAMCIRKTAVVYVPLADRFKKRRILCMLIAWSCILLSIACLIGGIALGRSQLAPFVLLLCPILIFAGALTGIFGCRVVYAKKIDDNSVWLHGVCEEFLSQYPEYPYAK